MEPIENNTKPLDVPCTPETEETKPTKPAKGEINNDTVTTSTNKKLLSCY